MKVEKGWGKLKEKYEPHYPNRLAVLWPNLGMTYISMVKLECLEESENANANSFTLVVQKGIGDFALRF